MSHRGKSTDRRLSDPGEPSQGERRRGRRADPRPRPRPPPSSKPGDHAAEAVRRPFSSPYHLIHLACIERETVPHQLGFTKRLLVAPRRIADLSVGAADDVVGREPLEWAIRCLPGLLHARHVDAVPGPDSSAADSRSPPRPRHRSSSRSRSRRRRRAHAHAGAQTRSDAREHGHSPGRACRAGCQAVFQPCTIMLYGCTGAGGRIRSGRQPASLLGLGIQRLTALRASPASSSATSRVPAAERGPAQRALDRRLDHDAFRFRQPWSSRDQVMVLGPVAALLGGGQAWPPRSWPRRATGATRCRRGTLDLQVVAGRSRSANSGGPEQLVVGREGQERPFSPDVWGARRPPASTTSTSPSTSSRFTGAGRVQPRAARGGAASVDTQIRPLMDT